MVAMSYRHIDSDQLRHQYGFKVCRSISYFLLGVGLSRLLAYLAMVPGLHYLTWALWAFWAVLMVPMAMSIVLNIRSDRLWYEGINPSRFVMLCAVAIVALMGLGMELHRIGG